MATELVPIFQNHGMGKSAPFLFGILIYDLATLTILTGRTPEDGTTPKLGGVIITGMTPSLRTKNSPWLTGIGFGFYAGAYSQQVI